MVEAVALLVGLHHRQEAVPVPVSYTHLDVYKRQFHPQRASAAVRLYSLPCPGWLPRGNGCLCSLFSIRAALKWNMRKCGIDKEKLSEKDLKALMNYGKTGLVTVKPTFGYESYELQ